MRFKRQGTLNQPAHGFNFNQRDLSGPASPAHQGVDARGGDDVQHAIQTTANEDIVGKQRKYDFLFAVLPLANRAVLRQKYLESLPRQGLGHHTFMLMAGVKRMPPADASAGVKA